MINNRDYSRTNMDRIELHKKKLYEGNYYENKEDESTNSPFIYQSIICMFIFSIILVVKLVNFDITNNFTSLLKEQLAKDDLPKIMSLVQEGENLNFDIETIFGNNFDVNNDYSEVSLNPEELTDENEDDYTTSIPKTEFTIDDNILEQISSDETSLLEKK